MSAEKRVSEQRIELEERFSWNSVILTLKQKIYPGMILILS
jgi:hypothetical protein